MNLIECRSLAARRSGAMSPILPIPLMSLMSPMSPTHRTREAA
ncbi:hypothetical protein [Burkholderia territorii]|nr:hypothetical protein [Burkholderia territorii]